MAAPLLPKQAKADTFVWCIDGGVDDPSPPACHIDGCTNSTDFVTLGEALEAAEAAAADSPGEHEHVVCNRSGSPLDETLSIDVASSALRGTLILSTADSFEQFLCRPLSAPPDQALIDIDGNGEPFQLSMASGLFRSSECERTVAPLLRASDIEVGLSKLRVVGGAGPAMQLDRVSLNITDFRVQDVDGPAIVGSGDWSLYQGEISNNETSGTAVLDHEGGDIEVRHVAFFANHVEGVPLLDSTSAVAVRASHFGHNVVSGGAPLLRFSAGPLEVVNPTGLWQSSLEANRLLGSADVVLPPAEDPGIFPDNPPFCLPLGADSLPYRQRSIPEVTTGEASGAALIEVRGSGVQGPTVFALHQAVVVSNEGSGALLSVESSEPTHLSLLHNTVEPNGAALVRGSSPELSLLTARNAFIDGFAPSEVDGLSSIEATMDLLVGPQAHPLEDAVLFSRSLRGPFQRVGTADELFLGADGSSLSSCARLARICPELADGCEDRLAGDDEVPCALGGTAAYLLSDELPAAVSGPWPWLGSWGPGVGNMEPAGFTGTTCQVGDLPLDAGRDAFGPTGDGDAFSTLTDCDNEDDDVRPQVPSSADVVDGPCASAPETCFVCPDGLERPGDDDDSAVFGDDDDSGEPAPPTSSSCEASGCGISWAGLPLFVVVGLPSRRRRATVSG